MTNELKGVIGKIDDAFIEHFKNDPRVKTIFVAGSMAFPDYQDRMDNDYDIRVISSNVTKEQLIKFEEFLDDISKKLSTDDMAVGYSCLVGPVNHKVSTSKKNVLIHAMIHQSDQMDDFLPVTHKYQYGTRYRIVYGEDSIKRFQDVRYNLEELLNAHEGLRYCIDMLNKKEYRYLTWDINDDNCVFNFHAANMTDDIVLENCFYSHNKFINNLINYCKWNDYEIPDDRFCFVLKLFGIENCGNDTLLFLYSLLNKKDKFIKDLCNDPLKETIKILKVYEDRVKYLDDIFMRKSDYKCLVKS